MSGKPGNFRGSCDTLDLNNALECLMSIDYVAILENKESMSNLFSKFNIPYNEEKINQSTNIKDKQNLDVDEYEFKLKNSFDYIIYEKAKKRIINI